MPRLPVRIQSSPFGPQTTPAARIPISGSPSLQQKGPAIPIEQFNHPDPVTNRALNQIQQNVRQALQQIKSLPHGNGNLLQNVVLTQGSASIAAPFNTLPHGLGFAYQNYHIMGTKGGYIKSAAIIAPTSNTPADRFLVIWTDLQLATGSTQVVTDIWVWG